MLDYVLYHHGIKGMRWGVRRFQKSDGSLTNAGKMRYKDSVKSEKAKSKHRLRLEKKYKELGLTDEQASDAADKRIRTEKILAASAALTIGACAAYVANKKIRERIDGVIKAGEQMQRIEMQDTNGKLHDMFYVAKGRHDSKRYEGLLGYTRQQQTGEAWLMKLEATKDVKVASQNKAAKIFGEMYKNDPEFRDNVKSYVNVHFNGQNRVSDLNDMSSKNIRKMYENFNCNIMGMRGTQYRADNKFYNKLKSAGYGAIQDINDMKYSGYRAKNPLIVFDTPSSGIMVKSAEKIATSMESKAVREQGKIACGELMETMGPRVAIGLSGAAALTYISEPQESDIPNKQ